MNKKRYAIVGVGGRGLGMFILPMDKDLGETAEIVALCDNNADRLAHAATRLGKPVGRYTDFEQMLRQANPDGVIIATRDDVHAQYVIAALRAGKRVFCEKPLCISAGQCRDILAVAKQTGGTCLTTHNGRYSVAIRAVRDVIQSGRLGRIKFIQFEETLDRCHGADYFRRWHRNKAVSGGLQIHKASHHFDMINWWVGSRPIRVVAQGGLKFYGANNEFRNTRCQGCPYSDICDFYVDISADKDTREMYQDAESADGYIRDGCVWDESIDIEDQLNVQIAYKNGIQADYTLMAFSPIESQRVIVECDKGRIEFVCIHNTAWCHGRCRLPGVEKLVTDSVKLYIPNVGVEEVILPKVEGSHGGGDTLLRADLFARDWDLPPTEMMASLGQAVQAVLIGAAVNKSLATGRPVKVQSLLKKD